MMFKEPLEVFLFRKVLFSSTKMTILFALVTIGILCTNLIDLKYRYYWLGLFLFAWHWLICNIYFKMGVIYERNHKQQENKQ